MNKNMMNPAAVGVAKILMGLGIAGAVLWLSPWTPEVLLKSFILPALVLAMVAAGLGLAGRGMVEAWNASTGEWTAKQVVDALKAEAAAGA